MQQAGQRHVVPMAVAQYQVLLADNDITDLVSKDLSIELYHSCLERLYQFRGIAQLGRDSNYIFP